MTGDVLDTPEAGPRVIRGGVLRTAGFVAGLLAGLVATPLVVRHLGVVDFGRYITVTSLVFIVGGLSEAGLSALGIREYSVRGPGDRERFMRNLTGMRTVFTAAGVLVAIAFALVSGYERVLVVGTVVAGAGLVVSNLQYTYSIPLSVELRLGWVALLDFLRQVAVAALSVGLVVIGAGLLPFYAVLPASAVIVLALTLGLVRRRIPLSPAFDMAEWKLLLRDTLPFAAATALGVVYFRVAVMAMSLLSTSQQTGYFGAAFRIIELVTTIPWMLVVSAFPILARAARDDQDRLRYALQRLFEVSLIVSAGLAVVIGVGAEFAIDVVGGEAFGPSTDALRVLGVALVGTFLVATWGYALLSLRKHSALLVANALALLVGVTLSVILIPPHGAIGGAIATTATEIFLATAYLVALVRERPDLASSPRVVAPVLVAVAVAVAPALLLDPHPAVAAAISGVLFVGVLAALRALPAEILLALLPSRRPRA